MNKIINNKIFKIIINTISILLILTTIFMVHKLNLLPNKYIILGSITLILINTIGFIFTYLKPIVLKTIGYIIPILLIIISIFGIYYVNTTDNFLNKAFNNAEDKYTNTFHIVVLKSSNLTISNLEDNTLGYYKDDTNINNAIDKLIYKTNTTTYDDINTMFNNLGTSINFILIEDSLYSLTFELNVGLNKDDYKIIFSYDVYYDEVIEEDTINTSNNINIYIGGTDFTNKLYDLNMIVSINTTTHKILLTSIPRDYHITVHGKDKKDNLGYHGIWGITTSKASLEDLLDIKIDYYVKVNTNSLVGVVDTLGGLDFCSNTAFTTTHATILDSYNDSLGKRLYVPKGCNNYSGIEILTIARERLAFSTGDRQRQKNCQQIIISIFDSITSPSNLTNYNSILNSISSLYTTNISRDIVTDYIKDIIDNNTKWTFETQSLDGTDSKGYVHLSNLKDYIMIPNVDSINNAKNKIEEIMSTTKGQ